MRGEHISMRHLNIGLIGANGRLNRAIINRLCEKGYREGLIGSVRHDQSNPFDIRLTKSTQQVFDQSELVVIGVQPKQVIPVLRNVRARSGTVIFSPVAGLRCRDMMNALNNPDVSVVRGMLNTAVSVGETVTILTSFYPLSEKQKAMVDEFVSVLGKGFWVSNDDKLDELTPAAGCGLVYFFKIVQSMTDRLVEEGLPYDVASKIAEQLLQGAATLNASSPLTVTQLISDIVTPGGPTDKLIRAADEAGFDEMMAQSMRAAAVRCKEISQELQSNVSTGKNIVNVRDCGFFRETHDTPPFPRRDFGLEGVSLRELF